MGIYISENYWRIYGDFWNPVDKRIVELVKKHIDGNEHLLEVGFGSGHYLAALTDMGVNVDGIEIRYNAYEKTRKAFEKNYANVKLIHGDALNVNEKYDLVYSTGLVQCLPNDKRKVFFEHISKISDKVIYTVPQVLAQRNIGSLEAVAVSGCEEFVTNNLAYELSEIYKYVEVGIWNREDIGLDDDFVWFYCDSKREK